MTDVRALLRQQRAARRVDHPHAVYSDAGKLSCSVCHDPVRTEAAWDDHVRSQLHRTSVARLHSEAQSHAQPTTTTTTTTALEPTDSNVGGAVHKRRRGPNPDGNSNSADDIDTEMDDYDNEGDDDGRNQKRPRSETTPPAMTALSNPQIQIQGPDAAHARTPRGGSSEARRLSAQQLTLTPPLARRTSGTPVQGVEMRIPSRPATPITTRDSSMGNGGPFGGLVGNGNGISNGNSNGGTSALSHAASTSTPKMGHLGRSPLVPQAPLGELAKPESGASALASATAALSAATSSASGATPSVSVTATAATVDEDEWAAFEAEVVNAPAASAASAAAAKPDFDAAGAGVISAAPVLANGGGGGVARPGDQHGEETTRREAEEAKREDEREEATRSLEEEFQEMQELESRVRKLREKREALRTNTNNKPRTGLGVGLTVFGAGSGDVTTGWARGADTSRRVSATMVDKENIRTQLAAVQKGAAGSKGEGDEDEEDDDDADADDDEDADWNVFRFRA